MPLKILCPQCLAYLMTFYKGVCTCYNCGCQALKSKVPDRFKKFQEPSEELKECVTCR